MRTTSSQKDEHGFAKTRNGIKISVELYLNKQMQKNVTKQNSKPEPENFETKQEKNTIAYEETQEENKCIPKTNGKSKFLHYVEATDHIKLKRQRNQLFCDATLWSTIEQRLQNQTKGKSLSFNSETQ